MPREPFTQDTDLKKQDIALSAVLLMNTYEPSVLGNSQALGKQPLRRKNIRSIQETSQLFVLGRTDSVQLITCSAAD